MKFVGIVFLISLSTLGIGVGLLSIPWALIIVGAIGTICSLLVTIALKKKGQPS